MKKRKYFSRFAPLFITITTIFLFCSVTLTSSAEEMTEIPGKNDNSGDIIEVSPVIADDSGDSAPNIFEELYYQAEKNADKIFSALAFLATLVVGIFYKSGLLPMLKDALSRLKSSVEVAKEAEEMHNRDTNDKIDTIKETVSQMEKQIERIELGSQDIEKLCREREAMRTILTSQVDMLYAIFICSSLPEYQKEEIGLKIQEMREELGSYEQG